MVEELALTLREAAFVFQKPLKEITRKVEEHLEIPRVLGRMGKRRVRLLGMRDLLYVQALDDLEDYLSPKGRLALHESLVSPEENGIASVKLLKLQVDDLKTRIDERLRNLQKLKDQVEGDPDYPLIKGTDIEVYRVGALFKDYSLEEVQEDYPNLSEAQLKLAKEYSEALPKQGRPYPSKSTKRTLMDLDFSALDEV